MQRQAPLPRISSVPYCGRDKGMGAVKPFAGQTIGLLGGSFNPAHEGHVHISQEALRRLNLDAVWWLVSPQNPLKARTEMASLEKRLIQARAIAQDRRIYPMALESLLGTRYTADTLNALRRLYPKVRFVWLMGADNLGSFHKWRRWSGIMSSVPVAVLDRPLYSISAPMGKTAQRFKRDRVRERKARYLARMAPAAWVLLRIPRSPLSATDLRAKDADWLIEG